VLCSKSQILRYFHVDVPPLWLDSHVHLTARIIEKSADLLAEKSAEIRFYILFYPESKLPERLGKELEGSSVEVLDYSRLINRSHTKYRMQYDSHPTPLAHQAVRWLTTRETDHAQCNRQRYNWRRHRMRNHILRLTE